MNRYHVFVLVLAILVALAITNPFARTTIVCVKAEVTCHLERKGNTISDVYATIKPGHDGNFIAINMNDSAWLLDESSGRKVTDRMIFILPKEGTNLYDARTAQNEDVILNKRGEVVIRID